MLNVRFFLIQLLSNPFKWIRVCKIGKNCREIIFLVFFLSQKETKKPVTLYNIGPIL